MGQGRGESRILASSPRLVVGQFYTYRYLVAIHLNLGYPTVETRPHKGHDFYVGML